MNQFIINYQIKKSGYLPEGVDETIPQITNKLNADMMQFKQLFDSKYSAEEELEKERKGFSDAAFCILFCCCNLRLYESCLMHTLNSIYIFLFYVDTYTSPRCGNEGNWTQGGARGPRVEIA